MYRRIAIAALISISVFALDARADDWPQFRYGAGRGAASPEALPEVLELVWTRSLPTPRPAFPHELRLAYDHSYEPVVSGGLMFVPSMVTDSVTALDAETGAERWRFFAEGPVRFAPVAWEDRIYFVSDDGYLYCVSATDGALAWKFRGLPEGRRDRKVIGHGRLISLWPARGGPVLADGVVYFAAGLWPTEGVFVHAVDAESGEAVWSNTEGHLIPESNWDHGIGHDSGLTPQGYLAIVDGQLVVPCGAQLPAFLDLATGKLKTYTMGWGGRNGLPKGCWFVAGAGSYLSHGGDLFDISRPSDERFAKTKQGESDYKRLLYPGGWTRLDIERDTHRELDSFRQPVLTPTAMYESDLRITARDLTDVSLRKITKADLAPERTDDPYPDTVGGAFRTLWELESDLDVHIMAGPRLYVGRPNVVAAIDTSAEQPNVAWRTEIDGTPHRMLAADGKLFVVTTDGTILAFGRPTQRDVVRHVPSTTATRRTDDWTERTGQILDATGDCDGYALVLGIRSGRLVEELAAQTTAQVIAVDSDPSRVTALRSRLHAAGLYGTRVTVLLGDPVDYPFSPYLADLVVTETPDVLGRAGESRLIKAVYHALRPYGGVACATGPLADRSRIEQLVQAAALPGASVDQSGKVVLLRRDGPLPGAADWSHAQADAASTGASQDDFIRAPMTVLWFDAAQRWHKFPGQEQVRVAGGRLVLLEEGVLCATDVYTGRRIWEIELPMGANPLDDALARGEVRYQRHRIWGPEASLSGTTELVVLDDAIYLSDGRTCLVFDPASGDQTGAIALPNDLTDPWNALRVVGNRLIGTSGATVVCLDRHTGELQWRLAMHRPSLSVAVGENKVFVAEIPDPKRGEDVRRDGRLLAIDLATGAVLWERQGGARLRYSPVLDLVVTPYGFYRAEDGQAAATATDVPEAGYTVKGGRLPEAGIPGYLAGDRLLTGNEQTLVVRALPSGEPIGKPVTWVRRGCTGTRASAHLLTTRLRGNSAWIDLESREVTPLLGVRPGCSINNNLYPANGVLNIPNLTAGCTCNYAPVSAACIPRSALQRGGGQ